MKSPAALGYYSFIEKRYKSTEFLDIVIHALKKREQPNASIKQNWQLVLQSLS